MRSKFVGYYPPSDEELEDLWTRGLLVLDTNALLSLFRYTPATREQFFDVLLASSGRLWIPHHVGLEFHRTRDQVVAEQTDVFDHLSRAVSDARAGIEKVLAQHRRHPSLSHVTLKDLAKSTLDEFEAGVGRERRKHTSQIEEVGANASVLHRITELFASVGDEYGADRLEAVKKEGASRFEKKIPPGYQDHSKTNGNAFGDFIIWSQILDRVRAEPTPVIFVTDDVKDDWWQRTSGKTKGPRPEIVQEFADACGERIHLYRSESFLKVAAERLGMSVRDDAIREVEAVTASVNARAQVEASVAKLSSSTSGAAFSRWLTHLGSAIDEPLYLGASFDDFDAERLEAIETVLSDYGADPHADEIYPPSYIDDLLQQREALIAQRDRSLIERRVRMHLRDREIRSRRQRLERERRVEPEETLGDERVEE